MHIFHVCFIYLLVHQVSSNSSSVSRQVTCVEDGVVSCTSDCKSRLFCMLNNILTIDCLQQTGQPFCNPETLECDYSSRNCSSVEESDFICPDIGYYPHATDCTKFWICTATNATIGQCNNNMVFDPKNKNCSNVQCFNFSPNKGLCKGKEGTVIVHPLSKNIYFHCSGDFPQLNTCPENLIFNTLTLKCEPDCKAETVLKDPTDPQCYYNCLKTSTGVTPEKKCCDVDNVFDENVLACIPV